MKTETKLKARLWEVLKASMVDEDGNPVPFSNVELGVELEAPVSPSELQEIFKTHVVPVLLDQMEDARKRHATELMRMQAEYQELATKHASLKKEYIKLLRNNDDNAKS